MNTSPTRDAGGVGEGSALTPTRVTKKLLLVCRRGDDCDWSVIADADDPAPAEAHRARHHATHDQRAVLAAQAAAKEAERVRREAGRIEREREREQARLLREQEREAQRIEREQARAAMAERARRIAEARRLIVATPAVRMERVEEAPPAPRTYYGCYCCDQGLFPGHLHIKHVEEAA